MPSHRHHLHAFMKNPDAEKSNAIHSTSGAKDYGFQGALVGGATAYGWAASLFVETLGNQWLDFGWAHVRFRQPVYPGDDLVVVLDDDGSFEVRRDIDEVCCFSGEIGRGEAPWLGDIGVPSRRPPESIADPLPDLVLEDVPVGEELRTREVHLSVADAGAYARDKQVETLDCFYGSDASIHPAWIAEQPIHWLHHSYNYGPSIHTESRIQHLREGRVGQTYRVAGICRDAYERKGHHYIVNDTEIRDAADRAVARVQHTAIFRVRKLEAKRSDQPN